ncbi:hypothetical protein EWM62_03545 [Mucilaginibacter terrigena]|uniref:Lipoprotein n=1 Tax=Mucilaginibacter terrigena TaxID=2492395 RepID=A0A4Q5LSF5_9SPHI|nr:hypothetical protein [Mucilaginibacter terrigena]RYU92518.1 hypothetical protein EWM62_03545 [Mucilaginibacter terrigena]
MYRSILPLWIMLCVAFISCNNNKPKPVSDDITKTAVTVNQKKDSVINNPKKNYGNATVAEPCVKCIIGVIQKTIDYKVVTSSRSTKDIYYVVNWIEGAQPQDTTNKKKATNSLKVEILEKNATNPKVASFIYDNSLSKLYFELNNGKNEVNIDKAELKLIRDKCYWGVASAK